MIQPRPFLSCFILALCLTSPTLAPAQSPSDDFETWRNRQMENFAGFQESISEGYAAYAEAQATAFADFKREVEALWGAGNAWMPDRRIWVQYEQNLTRRTRVDFAEGRADVELIFEAGTLPQGPALDRLLREHLQYLLLSGTEDPIEVHMRMTLPNQALPQTYVVQRGDSLWGLARAFNTTPAAIAEASALPRNALLQVGQILRIPGDPPQPPEKSKIPLLAGQVSAPGGQALTSENAAQTAQAILAAESPQRLDLLSPDGTERVAFRVSFKLLPNHLQTRAQRYDPIVRRFARQYDIDPRLIFAIIETESSFNPRARSHVPAFGLMQLVPASGARDAYRYVFSEDRLVDADYLFDPERNIRLGVAYLHILNTRYLRSIEDHDSRLWCVISAYNTGAGNVSRAFTGNTSVTAAARLINTYDPEMVYQRLQATLPYEETQKYLQKVRTRIGNYSE